MGGRTHGKDTETIIAEIQKHHGNNLLYDKVVYKNSNTKIVVGCKIHGYFEKYPNDLKNGRGGCPRCNNSYQKTNADFIAELSIKQPHLICEDVYKNAKTKLVFRCTKHNYTFESVPYSVLAMHTGCPDCSYTKQQETKVDKGQVADPAEKTLYERYRRDVWRYSNRTYKEQLNRQTRDRHNHLDHVLSIVDGFNNNVPAQVMGSVHNLRIISGQANRHKSYRSDISVDELLERYNK